MTNILHIDSSPRGRRSHSRKLSAEVAEKWKAEAGGDAVVVHHDLSKESIGLIDEAWIGAAYTPEGDRTPAMRHALESSERLIDEVLVADKIVIGVSMVNFGIPPVLKAWIDQVVRVGRTFQAHPLQGLARGKQAVLVVSAGGDYTEGSPIAHLDAAVPQLRAVLGFIGITDVTVLRIVANGGDELLETSFAKARAVLAEPAARIAQ